MTDRKPLTHLIFHSSPLSSSLQWEAIAEVRYWLLAIASTVVAIHLTNLWRLAGADLLALGGLTWLAVGGLIWERRQTLTHESGLVASAIGVAFLGIFLLKSAHPSIGRFAQIAPLVAALGLILIASGWQGVRQYWKELSVLAAAYIPKMLLDLWLSQDLTLWTAKFANLLLGFFGIASQRQGIYLILPSGTVEVMPGCSGLESISYLWGLTAIFLALFPLSRRWLQGILPVIAAAVAFCINGLRIALLTILHASGKEEALNYWHDGDGSLLFIGLSVALFGSICWIVLHCDAPQPTVPRGM